MAYGAHVKNAISLPPLSTLESLKAVGKYKSTSRTPALRIDKLSQICIMVGDVDMVGASPTLRIVSPSLDTLALTAALLAPMEHVPAVPPTAASLPGPLRPRPVDLNAAESGASVGDPRLVCLEETMDLMQDPSAYEDLMPTVLSCACSATKAESGDPGVVKSENNRDATFGFNLGETHISASRQHDDQLCQNEGGGVVRIEIAATARSGADPVSRGGVENNGNPLSNRSERARGWLARSELTSTGLRGFCDEHHPVLRLAPLPPDLSAIPVTASRDHRPAPVVPRASPSPRHAPYLVPLLSPSNLSKSLDSRLRPLSPFVMDSSMSKRRRAPEWPLPRRMNEALAPDELGLQQTIKTPAVLRVPPTPLYSPAFYRSGYNQRAPVKIGQSSTAPLSPRHPPYSSAPVPPTARLDNPATPTLPRGWVIEQLNRKAPQYWHNPSTSDVRLMIPVHKARPPRATQDTTQPDTAASTHSNQPGPSPWSPPSQPRERRESLPSSDNPIMLVFPLHQDYLYPQSSLLRTLLSSSSSQLDTVHMDGRPSSAGGPPRVVKGARLLPTSVGEPLAVYLPLPDPSSFSLLVHWLYWGDVTALEAALSRGTVEWQGVVKNIHYLGMDDSIKRVMGRWWRQWVKTERPAQARTPEDESDVESEHGLDMGSEETEVPPRRVSADDALAMPRSDLSIPSQIPEEVVSALRAL